jgi:hypothetical protein
MAASKSKSARYYASNPEAAAKKARYQRKLNKDPAVKKASEERWAERKKRGIAGKGGKDLSHRTDGKMVLESVKANRSRNGAGNNAIKKPVKRRKPK